MKKLHLITLFLLMLGITSNVMGQFTTYTTGNSNLPSNFVAGGVAIDTNNNVWVGTDAGVAKFDGATWTIFTTAQGLPSNNIICIAVDIDNNIWIGTDGDGIAKYDGSAWTVYTYTDGLCDNGIHYIACEPNGDMWFASWGAGVSKLSGTTWTTYNAGNGFPNDAGAVATVYYITFDGSNNKWFATDMGLVKYDNSAFSTINMTSMPNLQSNYIMAVAADGANNKWVAVQNNGLAKLNAGDAWVANYDTSSYGIYDMGINDIKIASDGSIWLGEYTMYGALIKGGITRFDAATGMGVSVSTNGLFEDQVFRIAIDQNDAVWVATGEGLSKYIYQSGLNENLSDLKLELYPNPAHDFLYIQDMANTCNAQITDITGRVVFNQVMTAPVKINLENYVDGVYLIKVVDNEKVYSGKFIKD